MVRVPTNEIRAPSGAGVLLQLKMTQVLIIVDLEKLFTTSPGLNLLSICMNFPNPVAGQGSHQTFTADLSNLLNH